MQGSPEAQTGRWHQKMDLVAHGLRLTAAAVLLVFAWTTGFAGNNTIALTLYILFVFVPLSPIDYLATQKGITATWFRVLIAAGHTSSVFIVAVLAPSTRPAVLIGYLLMAVDFALLGGRRDGFFVTLFAVPLGFAAELSVPPDERMAPINLFVFAFGCIFVSILVDGLTSERRKQADLLQRLNDALALASSADGLPATTDATVRAAARAVDARLVTLVLVDEQEALQIGAFCSSREPPREGDAEADEELARQVARADGPARAVLEAGRTMVLQPGDHGSDSMPRSVLVCTPLRHDARPIGVLATLLRSGERPSPQTLALLASFAETAALALARAQTYELQRDALARLQSAESAKLNVLRTVSHELRTPLAAVRGFLSLLDSRWESLDEHTRLDYLSRALDRADGLGRLIERVVDFTRLESDLKFVALPTYVGEMVHQAIARNADLLRHVTTSLHVDPHVRVVGDGLAISRVLDHLLDNAAKFSPEGSTVTIKTETGVGTVRLIVSDDGPGIAAEDRESIFELMRQGGSQDLGGPSMGLGLGLAISRRYAELMNGTLHAANETGDGGSTFVLELPRAAAEHLAIDRPNRQPADDPAEPVS